MRSNSFKNLKLAVPKTRGTYSEFEDISADKDGEREEELENSDVGGRIVSGTTSLPVNAPLVSSGLPLEGVLISPTNKRQSRRRRLAVRLIRKIR